MPKLDLPWFAFYPADWIKDDRLGMSSIRTQGVWIRALSFMFLAATPGELRGSDDRLARLIGCSLEEWSEFCRDAEELRFCDYERDSHGIVTVRNRRMQRDTNEREKQREYWKNKQRRYRGNRENAAGQESVPAMSPNSQPLESESQSQSDRSDPTDRIAAPGLKPVPDAKPPRRRIKQEWPEELVLSPAMIAYARENAPEIDPVREFEHWRVDCLSNGRAYRNWDRAWENRILNAPKFAGRNGAAPSSPAAPKPRDMREQVRKSMEEL